MTPLRARVALVATTLALSAILSGCGFSSFTHSEASSSASVSTVPAGKVRAPDATGTIEVLAASDGAVSITFAPDAGFEYFAGATLSVPPSAFPHGEDGVTLAPSDLSVGERINVWVGLCRETMPVQCDVERVELAL
jgi:hypothetical protein